MQVDAAVTKAKKLSKMQDWKARVASQLSDNHSAHVARAAVLHAEHRAFLAHTLYHHKQDELAEQKCQTGVNVVCRKSVRFQVLRICQARLFIPI
jgi:hypothetical protein